jgi:hypothetical protein
VGIEPVPGSEQPPALARDASGRFLAGNGGGGRRKGQRNKLTEMFVGTVADDFAEHGAAALASLRASDPAAYLKIIASFVPRELVMQREQEPDYADMTDEELNELFERVRRNRAVRAILEEPNR